MTKTAQLRMWSRNDFESQVYQKRSGRFHQRNFCTGFSKQFIGLRMTLVSQTISCIAPVSSELSRIFFFTIAESVEHGHGSSICPIRAYHLASLAYKTVFPILHRVNAVLRLFCLLVRRTYGTDHISWFLARGQYCHHS